MNQKPTSAEHWSAAVESGLRLERMNALGSMTGSLAHELNNPLATIIATIQGLLSFWPDSDPISADGELGSECQPPSAVKSELQSILDEARRAGVIVADLLSFTGARPDPRESATVGNIVARAARFSRHHLKMSGVELTVRDIDGVGDSATVMEPAILAHTVLSLVLTARKEIGTVSQDGGGWIHVELKRDTESSIVLSVLYRSTNDRVRPLRQPETWDSVPGILDEIIDAGGGRIDRTQVAHGSGTINLHLATAVPDNPAAQHTRTISPVFGEDTEKTQAPELRVLLVDDEEGVRRSLGRFLARSGFRVDTAANGREALERMRAERYDAVVSDLRMPGLSGEELYDRVCKELPEMAERIIFSSGDMMREETSSFLEATGCPALEKPYELAQLVGAIRDVHAAALDPDVALES